MIDREQTIREAAYYKWDAAGRPEGRELDFWAEAEREQSSEPGVPKAASAQMPTSAPAQASPLPHATSTAAASAPEAPARVPQSTANRNQRRK